MLPTNITLALLAISIVSGMLYLLMRGERSPAPDGGPTDGTPGEVDANTTPDVSNVVPLPPRREGILREQKHRRAHRAELLSRVEGLIAPHRLKVEFNRERGMWQAWTGAKSWDEASVRSEKSTEIGAIRAVLNSHGVPSGNFWILTAKPVKPKRRKPSRRRSAVDSTPPEGRLRKVG